ncbi:hypothetical protein BaRGS_00014969 [Batillaria attramentaria]|uniref:C2H2-type domain-containing protein n=1 Tax=Batillaria attramentaria TaxID=370345 RepID=A0ABD0L3D1_9CAEN
MASSKGIPGSTCNSAAEWNTDSKFPKCSICSLPILSQGRINIGAHSNMQHYFRVCSSVCAQLYAQTFGFVQGFILGKVLCALLDLHGSSIRSVSLKSERQSPDQSQDKPHRSEDEFVTDLPVPLPVMFSPTSSDCGSALVIDTEPETSCTKGSTESDSLCKSKGLKKRKCQGKPHALQKHKKTKTASSSSLEEEKRAVTLSAPSKERNEKSKVMCFECGKEFLHKSSLDSHTRLKHKKDARTCRVCGKECYGPAGLSIHMHKVHKDEKPVDCDLCDQKFSSSADRDRHLTLDHGKKHGMCHICGKYFKFSGALRSHILAHSGIRRFVCEHCGKGFLRSNTLRDHKKLVHFCQGCQKEFASCVCPDGPRKKCPLRRKKSAIKNFSNKLQCYMCYKTLENIQSYKAHMNAHKNESPYGCDVCGKRFMHKAGLQTHMHQHKAKRFECDICRKTFTYKCNMESHREVHNEDKPYACEFCSKTFKTKTVLENHRRGHTDPRQFDCHICGKSLTKRSNLKRHLKVMHPNTENVSSRT